MSRLFYSRTVEKKDVGHGNNGTDKTKEYLEKVAKLIPSEIVAIYLALVGLVPAVHFAIPKAWLFGAAFALCFVLTPIYLSYMADKDKPKAKHLVFSTIAFVVWAYSVSGQAALPSGYYDAAFAGMITVAFTGISGLFPIK